MSLHTVTIHGDTITEDGDTYYENVRIEFVCAGDETSPCHQYPDCGCEYWDDDHETDRGPEHAPVPHEKCWMQDWFDNDAAEPNSERIEMPFVGDEVLKPGMSGPITTSSELDYVVWKFENEGS